MSKINDRIICPESDVVIVVNKKLKISWMNSGSIIFFKKDLTGKNYYQELFNDLRFEGECAVSKCFNDSDTHEQNKNIRIFKGDEYQVKIIACAAQKNSKGTPEYVAVFLRDIIKNRSSAQNQKEPFIESFTHDFNNILASILGYTELSIELCRKGTFLYDNLHNAYLAGKKARDLVRQLNNTSSITSKDKVSDVECKKLKGEINTRAILNDKFDLTNKNILFVDDEKAVADICENLLGRLGYRVKSITDPKSALNIFAKNPFDYDLVVTDKSMPSMSGFEFALEIKTIRKSIPVILCTGFSEEDDIEKAELTGISDVIIKPVAAAEFSEKIKMVLKDFNIYDHREKISTQNNF